MKFYTLIIFIRARETRLTAPTTINSMRCEHETVAIGHSEKKGRKRKKNEENRMGGI